MIFDKQAIARLKNWALLIVLAIVLFLYSRSCNRADENQDEAEAYAQSLDSLRKIINAQGEEITATNVILADYNTIKFKLKTADSTVKKLQKIIDKHTTSATVLNTQTSINGTSGTTINKADTVYKDSLIYIYPVYETIWGEKWSRGKIVASKDSISRNIVSYDEYNIKQSYKKQPGLKGFLKPRILEVEVTNKNPNTETTALKSFALEPDKKTRKRAFIAGIVAGAAIYYAGNKIMQ